MAKYRKQYRQFPLTIPRGPCAELVSMYEELRLDVIPPPVRERPANRWISEKTWAAIDKRATMQQKGHLTMHHACRMGRKIKSLLAADRKQRAADAASTVEGHLSNGAMKEAWQTLKGWYRWRRTDHHPHAQRPWSDRRPSAWNYTQEPPPWGKLYRSTSRTSRFPMTCPQTQRSERWLGDYEMGEPEGLPG